MEKKLYYMVFACGLIAMILCACGGKQNSVDTSTVVNDEYESSQPEASDTPVELEETDISVELRDQKSGDLPPMITVYDGNYVAPYIPVDELPDGYEFVGELDSEEANDTGLSGCKMYAFPEKYGFDRLYVYQECGTPIDENTVDSEKRQWAYVEWIKEGSETTNQK